MTSDELYNEQRQAIAERSWRESKCAHKWRVLTEFRKNTKKEVLFVCNECGAERTTILAC